jgi:chromosome segregation ATPase
MTVDERIEKLTERHEALAQSIELKVHENRERDEKWDKRFAQLVSRMETVNSSIESLAHIAEPHQHRLDSHDDRLDELEGNA